MPKTTTTKTKTKAKTDDDATALADMFAALTVASSRGAVKDWEGCRVQLRAATVLARDEKVREALGVIFEHLGGRK
jgi:hypothetical protein